MAGFEPATTSLYVVLCSIRAITMERFNKKAKATSLVESALFVYRRVPSARMIAVLVAVFPTRIRFNFFKFHQNK